MAKCTTKGPTGAYLVLVLKPRHFTVVLPLRAASKFTGGVYAPLGVVEQDTINEMETSCLRIDLFTTCQRKVKSPNAPQIAGQLTRN